MSAPRPRARVVALLGSPRARSNTRLLVERVLAGAAAAGAETELIDLRQVEPASCRHCGGCDKTGRCVVNDGVQEVHAKLRQANHLVLGSPIQFSGVSGQMKSMIDRGQAFWVEKYRLKRPVSEVAGERRGLFVATCGGDDRRVFEWAKHTVLAYFNSTGFRYWGELFEANTDRPPPMSERVDVLAKAEALGRRMIEAGPEEGV